MRITDKNKIFAAVIICMLIAAVSVTGGMLAQRRAVIPEIEVIDAEKETSAVSITETYVESEDTADLSSEGSDAAQNAVVNINTASAEELMSLNGIGEKTAAAIIEYRKDSPFEKPEDIMNVKGIGEKKYENIKNSICV